MPSHYDKDVQPWDAMAAWFTEEELEGFYRGNIIKYIARYKDKDGIKDIYKAQQYLTKLVMLLDKAASSQYNSSFYKEKQVD